MKKKEYDICNECGSVSERPKIKPAPQHKDKIRRKLWCDAFKMYIERSSYDFVDAQYYANKALECYDKTFKYE
jgi:hypothetical protein